MHLKSTFPALVAAALFAAASVFSHAAEKKKEKAADAATAPTESELIAKARATYPMKTCLVSDEALGDINEAAPFVYHQAGKPDRVVFFCCDGCSDDFKQDPAKYLAKLDAAAAGKKATPAKKADAKKDGEHAKHH